MGDLFFACPATLVAYRRSEYARGRRGHIGTSDPERREGGPMRTRRKHTRNNINSTYLVNSSRRVPR